MEGFFYGNLIARSRILKSWAVQCPGKQGKFRDYSKW